MSSKEAFASGTRQICVIGCGLKRGLVFRVPDLELLVFDTFVVLCERGLGLKRRVAIRYVSAFDFVPLRMPVETRACKVSPAASGVVGVVSGDLLRVLEWVQPLQCDPYFKEVIPAAVLVADLNMNDIRVPLERARSAVRAVVSSNPLDLAVCQRAARGLIPLMCEVPACDDELAGLAQYELDDAVPDSSTEVDGDGTGAE